MTWLRYRFYTNAPDDRPLVFNPKYPWWVSGYAEDASVIVAYLPQTENLSTYWPEAFDIDIEPVDKIEFTDRFPRPDYFQE